MRSPKHLALVRGLLIASLSGCGYTSRYSPPADARARPLWEEDHVANDLAQLDLSPACRDEVYWTAHPDAQHPPRPLGARNDWVPPPVTADPTAAPPPAPRMVAPIDVPAPEPLEEVLKFPSLIVVVLLVPLWPPIAIALATSPAESGRDTFDAIDEANAYNDLSRSTGTRCSSGQR